MTSSCCIVTSSLLHLLSSSRTSTASYSLSVSLSTTVLPFTFYKHGFANHRKFSKFRHGHSCTFEGPVTVQQESSTKSQNKRKDSWAKPKRWNTQVSLQTLWHMPKHRTSKHTHIWSVHVWVNSHTGERRITGIFRVQSPFPSNERVRECVYGGDGRCMVRVRGHLHPIWSMAILIWAQVSPAAPAFD